MRGPLLCAIVACVVCGSCQKPVTRLNAPPHGVTSEPSQMQAMYAHMIDNALLADMTISEIHFVPHRPMLNSLGETRLARLASLLDTYGGTVRFDTDLSNRALVEARTAVIVEFLSEAGMDASTDLVALDLPGGAGMDAGEAILIKAHEATYSPKKSGGDSDGESMSVGS